MAQKLTAILVDDDPFVLEDMKTMLDTVSSVALLKCFTDPIEAWHFIRKEQVDVAFLDVEMQPMDGLELARQLPKETKLVFVTAYREFALNAFGMKACDYLLKPVSYGALLGALTQVQQSLLLPQRHGEVLSSDEYRFFMKGKGRPPLRHLVNFDQLIYAQASEGGTDLYHLGEEQPIPVRESLQRVVERLPDQFFQVHRAFVINSRLIKYMDAEQIFMKNGTAIKKGDPTHFPAFYQWARERYFD